MKEKLTKNWFLKLISVFFGFFVWLAVVNIANPVKPGTAEVSVEIVNIDVLSDANLTYEIEGKKTATISYKVRTRDAYKIKSSDFRAYADLSEMYDVTGAIPIKVEVLNHEELFEGTPTVKAPGVIKIKTETLQTKRFELRVKNTGTPAEGYALGEVTLSPEFVYVRGPISQVGQISTVGIEFGVEAASSDLSGVATPVLYDANGNQLNLGESVELLSSQIEYNMVILRVKNLGLDFVVAGEVAPGYRYTGLEASIKSVPVAGLKSALASVNTITVQDPALSVENATSDKVCEINLNQYLPPNLSIVGLEDHTIQVTLKVEPLQSKTYTLKTENIVIQNMSEEFEYTFLSDTIDVTVQGLKDDLNTLTAEHLNASANAESWTEGTHPAQLTFKLDDSYKVIGYTSLQVKALPNAANTDGNVMESSEEETSASVAPTEENDLSEE